MFHILKVVSTCQVCLCLFLGSCLITSDENLEQQCRTTDRFSSSRQIIYQSDTPEGVPFILFYGFFLASPFCTPSLLLLVMPGSKQGVYPTPSNERECKWAYAQDQLTVMLCNSRLCGLCLSIWLLIIQSVIIICRIFMSP